MKPVIQEESSGCGIAAVAVIAEKPYAEVKRKANALGIFAEDEKLYSDTGYVRQLLREYAIPVSDEETPFSCWAALPRLALLAIKYRMENGRPLWHWVVFSRRGNSAVVYDSAAYLENNERTDFNEMRPAWYIGGFKNIIFSSCGLFYDMFF